MRFAIVATAIVLAISVAGSTTSFAAAKQKAKAMSVNECIDLAIQRGFTRAAVDQSGAGGRTSPARNFVIRCMQGRQR